MTKNKDLKVEKNDYDLFYLIIGLSVILVGFLLANDACQNIDNVFNLMIVFDGAALMLIGVLVACGIDIFN